MTAEREATLLARRGALAVALTGSLARGDAGPGSDVDLWVVGDRERRRHLERDGVPVTILEEPISVALSLERFSRVEVAQTRVLYDPMKIFPRITEAFLRHRSAARQLALEHLSDDVRLLDDHAQQCEQQVLGLLLSREALLLRAGRLAFAQHGLRAVKFRHLRERLEVKLVLELRRALGLDRFSASAVRAALLTLTPGRRDNNAVHKLDQRQLEEGTLLARREVLLAHSRGRTPVARLESLMRWWLRSSLGTELRTVFGLEPSALRRQQEACDRAAIALDALFRQAVPAR